jgi:tRNA threonylcarbamoyladenosine biosynthesis protein TsaE
MSDGEALPWDVETADEAGSRDRGRRLAALCHGNETIRLVGDLGAGKTTFTQGLAEGLGAGPHQVHSPSYSLVHLYRDPSGSPVLYHVDLYRVEGAVDLEEIGLEEVFTAAIPVAVEWPERLSGSRFSPQPGDFEVCLNVLDRHRRRLRVRQVPS